MKKIINFPFLLVLLVSCAFYGCREVIDLELRGTETPFTVVQGAVVDREGYSFVTITHSLDFYVPERAPGVSNAEVFVEDEQGNRMNFIEQSDSIGYYLPEDPSFKGMVGQTYHLTVKEGSKTFTASSYMARTTDIDSMVVRYVPRSPFKEEGYYMYFFAKEPQDTKDFYRWKVYKNDTLFNGAADILIASDEFVGEDIENLELPYSFKLGDTVRLEQYSISEEVYNYYNQLLNSLFNDGGLFSPPPSNPETNIKGGAQGVFTASALASKELVIEE